MKRYLLIAVLFLLCAPAYGQRVHFADTTNVWSSIDSNTGCCLLIPVMYTTAYYDSGSSFSYNGLTYHYIISTTGDLSVREDSGKVYALGAIDSVERVLYDFTLGLNDTMRVAYSEDIFTAWVMQLDSTQLNGEWYKVWQFAGTDSSLIYTDSVRPIRYNVIEGIGCTNGLYYPLTPYSLTAFSQQLLCFNNHTGITTGLSNPVMCFGDGYNNAYDNNATCTSFYEHANEPVVPTGVHMGTIANNGVTVVPNPVNGNSRLILPTMMHTGRVVLMNGLGQIIEDRTFTNKDAVAIGDKIKTPGVYYYKVIDGTSGKVYTGNMVY